MKRVLVYGTFDLFHYGHLELLRKAKELSNNGKLIVAVNSDSYIKTRGKTVTIPSQDMILGAYYLTVQIDGEKGEGLYFKDEDEAMMAYQNGDVGLHCKVKVRRYDFWKFE